MSRPDPVNPRHYLIPITKEDGKQLQVIDIIEALGLDFHAGNALTYLIRCCRNDGGMKHAAHKDVEVDIGKAVWYLQRHLKNRFPLAPPLPASSIEQEPTRWVPGSSLGMGGGNVAATPSQPQFPHRFSRLDDPKPI